MKIIEEITFQMTGILSCGIAYLIYVSDIFDSEYKPVQGLLQQRTMAEVPSKT